MQCSNTFRMYQSHLNREFYSNIALLKEARTFLINNLTLYMKEVEKEEKNKPQELRK